MTSASPGVGGQGAWPGVDALEAQLTIFGDLGDAPDGVLAIPFLPQLAERGPGADPVGRTCALLPEPPVELGPHGWRLADHGGMDLERARGFWREDLDALAIAANGYAGPLSVQLVGPWTLAATLYLARGDRVLADRGAVREVTLALAEAAGAHVAHVRALVPGADVVVQLDEHLLGAVRAGVLPTFSGYSRLRAVPGPDLAEGLRTVLDAVRAAGASSVVQVGSGWVGIEPVAVAGAGGIGLDLAASGAAGGSAAPWNAQGWELIARAVERGMGLWTGLPPTKVSQCSGPEVRALAEVVTVPWRRIGLPVADLDRVVLTTADGSGAGVPGAGAPEGPDHARAELGNLARAAEILAELSRG